MSYTGEAEIYQIKVAGGLDPTWSDWLGGMEIITESGSQGLMITILTGRVADQATLRGILSRIWDLNLKLISVHPIEPSEKELEK